MSAKINVYILHGSWDNAYTDGNGIVAIAHNIERLKDKLENIKETKAMGYVGTLHGDLDEDYGERHYEVTDAYGAYAKFYIVENTLELPDSIMESLFREQDREYRLCDIKNALDTMYEAEMIEEEQREKAKNDTKVLGKILEEFDKRESCNIPFNVTMEETIKVVLKEEYGWKV